MCAWFHHFGTAALGALLEPPEGDPCLDVVSGVRRLDAAEVHVTGPEVAAVAALYELLDRAREPATAQRVERLMEALTSREHGEEAEPE